jgi:hypothetical protein
MYVCLHGVLYAWASHLLSECRMDGFFVRLHVQEIRCCKKEMATFQFEEKSRGSSYHSAQQLVLSLSRASCLNRVLTAENECWRITYVSESCRSTLPSQHLVVAKDQIKHRSHTRVGGGLSQCVASQRGNPHSPTALGCCCTVHPNHHKLWVQHAFDSLKAAKES